MSVYRQISTNKKKTFLIVFIFVVLISGFFWSIGNYFNSPESFFIFGIFFSLFSSLGSYFYSDKIVLMTTGAKPASKEEFFNFYTVAENLAMADGLPMPKLYVIDDPSPNAFATGRNPKHAVVCVTSGLLSKLDRTELEGVIAHELSHIKNFDILLASIVAVLVGSISLISNWVMQSFWYRGRFSSDDSDNNKSPFSLILLIIILIISPIIAVLIQLAISRKREFLADASGALVTRYPRGLARALEKISADNSRLRRASPSTAHLFIANPFKTKKKKSWLTGLFNTHPPVEERIKRLEKM